MSDTVRETKRADELKSGDWLAHDEGGDWNSNEVKAAFQYPTARGPRVHLTTQVPGKNPCSCGDLAPDTTFSLATEAEVAELREQAKRAQKIADIRAFADWLEANPDVAMPYGLGGQQDANAVEGQCSAEDVAKVRAFAANFGARVVEVDSQTRAEHQVGHIRYTLIAWHEDGRPAEPVADPLGLGVDLDRSQAADSDETPVPVAGRRYEPHTGGMTDQGLVDETPVEAQCPPECRQNWTRASDPLVHVAHCPKFSDKTPAEPAAVHPSWPTEAELKPWESRAPLADRIAESAKPIDPDSSMEAHYDAEAEAMTGAAITDACVITGWGGVCTTHQARHIASSEAECGCPVYPYAGRGDGADTIVDHRSVCPDRPF